MTSYSARIALLAGLALAATGARAQQSVADALRQDIEFARRKVYPALVNISVVVQYYNGGRAQRSPGAGSGVIVGPAGHVLTNFHVAGHTTRIVCHLPTGESIEAEVVAHDPLTDLSVLKLRMETRADPTVPLPFATLGDSEALRVGDHVIAMGNPFALSSSLTLGVVSNTARVFTDFTGTEVQDMDLGEGEMTGLFTRWIQHDALILPGNSGGPLVNLKGEVVGINELGGSGMGFAIPSNLAAQVMNQALTFGEVRRGWLGVTILPVDKLGRTRGALVSSLVPSAPADGLLQPGDVLLQIDSWPISVRYFEEVPTFYHHIAEIKPGTLVTLVVERKGEQLTVPATVQRMEQFLGDEEVHADHGISVREITAPMALVRRYPDDRGVLVTSLRPGLPFETAKPNIHDGDVILRVGDRDIADLAAFRDALQAMEAAGGKAKTLVAFRRGEEHLVTVVQGPEKKPEAGGGELPKAWLGARTQVLTPELATALGLGGRKGFRVTEVFPWTEASTSGLQAGDVITALDGDPLDASRPQDAEDLRRAIEDLPIGDEVKLTVWRAGSEQSVAVKLQESPASALDLKNTRQEELEFTVREVSFMDRVQFRLPPEVSGILVTEATMGGWAQMAGLRINDLLISAAGSPVGGIEAFEAVMEGILADRPEVVELFVRRGHRTHFVFIEPDWAKLDGSGK
ncbi:MAG: PDZ domain-containing protein [Planctomycetes bacterium]|nr:PDZ domain-containing protein [Planctomycetota bacterium]